MTPAELEEYFGRTKRESFKRATDAGLEIVKPGATDIQIDLDTPIVPDTFMHRVMMAEDLGLVKKFSEKATPSKGGNWHVTLQATRPLTPLDRLMLQALLGSDWKREMLSYQRYLNGDMEPSVLFRPVVAEQVA